MDATRAPKDVIAGEVIPGFFSYLTYSSRPSHHHYPSCIIYHSRKKTRKRTPFIEFGL